MGVVEGLISELELTLLLQEVREADHSTPVSLAELRVTGRVLVSGYYWWLVRQKKYHIVPLRTKAVG